MVLLVESGSKDSIDAGLASNATSAQDMRRFTGGAHIRPPVGQTFFLVCLVFCLSLVGQTFLSASEAFLPPAISDRLTRFISDNSMHRELKEKK